MVGWRYAFETLRVFHHYVEFVLLVVVHRMRVRRFWLILRQSSSNFQRILGRVGWDINHRNHIPPRKTSKSFPRLKKKWYSSVTSPVGTKVNLLVVSFLYWCVLFVQDARVQHSKLHLSCECVLFFFPLRVRVNWVSLYAPPVDYHHSQTSAQLVDLLSSATVDTFFFASFLHTQVQKAYFDRISLSANGYYKSVACSFSWCITAPCSCRLHLHCAWLKSGCSRNAYQFPDGIIDEI